MIYEPSFELNTDCPYFDKFTRTFAFMHTHERKKHSQPNQCVKWNEATEQKVVQTRNKSLLLMICTLKIATDQCVYYVFDDKLVTLQMQKSKSLNIDKEMKICVLFVTPQINRRLFAAIWLKMRFSVV